MVNIGNKWDDILKDEFKKDYYKNEFGLSIIMGDIDENGVIDALDAGSVLSLKEGNLKFEDMTKNNQYYKR